MTDINIRRATLDDISTIIHQRHHMFADMGYEMTESQNEMDNQFRNWIEHKLADKSYIGWLACDGDQVVAGVGLWLTPWIPGPNSDANARLPYLLNVYTEPAYRKRGLAKQLMEEALRYCREQGYKKVRLHASVYGRPLYEQLGFTNTNEMQFVF